MDEAVEVPNKPPRGRRLLARTLVLLLESTCDELVASGQMDPQAWAVLRDEYLPLLKEAS